MARKQRGYRYKNIVRHGDLGFINPYPWMAAAEAMVHLELERRRIPFSWRYFDGNAPTIKQLMPDFAPEFTLREARMVIVVEGEYFGTLPGVIDRLALAQVCLEEDGWKFVNLLAQDIERRGASMMLAEEAPELDRLGVRGDPRTSPYDPPTYMQELRQTLSALALRRARFAMDPDTPAQEREEDPRDGPPQRHQPRRRTRRAIRSRRRYRRSNSD